MTIPVAHPAPRLPHVVIIGGRFAGLHAARALRNSPMQVTLVDRTNHHLFQPLLYQVATASLSAGDITAPIRWILRNQRNAFVILGEATGIDVESKTVSLDTTRRSSLTTIWCSRPEDVTHISRTPSGSGLRRG